MKLKYLNLSLFFEQTQFLLPVMLFFYIKNGLTIGDYLFFQSITYVLYMVFGVPVGYVSDHISKKYALIIGYLLNVLRLVIYLIWGGYAVVLTGEILMTFIRFFTTGIADSYIFEYLKEKKQEKEMLHFSGKALMFMSFGVATGSLAGPVIYRLFGFEILLCTEFLFASIGTLLLLKLPKTKIYNRQSLTLADIKKACSDLWKNKMVRWLIAYNMLLYAATTIFVSTFQPLMKLSFVPVVFFGAVYFSNHMIRGISSRLTRKFVLLFGLRNLIKFGLLSVVLGFLLMMLAFELKNPYFTLACLFYICFVIGLQLVNQIANINEIHQDISPDIRATGISIYNMLCRGLGGVILALFQKISSDFNTANDGYFVFAVVFFLILFFLKSKQLPFKKL